VAGYPCDEIVVRSGRETHALCVTRALDVPLFSASCFPPYRQQNCFEVSAGLILDAKAFDYRNDDEAVQGPVSWLRIDRVEKRAVDAHELEAGLGC
jgi:hypothetical protein